MARGDAVGVFQFESEGMREALRKVQPTEFEDLVALGALYRPGAMDQIPAYARGKRNPETISFIDDRLRPITEATKGVILYQEQAMQIAKQLGGFSGPKADDLRKAIGKKNREAMARLKPEFVEGCRASGTSPDVIEALWATNERSADYSFNKCASGDTRVILPDGRRIRLSEAYRLQPTHLMSMWADGEVRPHTVAGIVRTGRKEVVRVRCASGRQIKATLDHRLLTTAGYMEIGDMAVGETELIAMPMISERQRAACRETMRRLAATPERKVWDQQAAARVREWQAGRAPEEKAAHMCRVHAMRPEMTRAGTAAMHERIKWLHANDPEWRHSFLERSLAKVRAYDTGPGYGHCSIASNGMRCASQPERDMCEWLIEQGVEFEMRKVLPNGRMCDFYFDGRYWEMDGMDRSREFFEAKYGDLPFVVVTPEDFRMVVEGHWETAHIENGDPIVSIEPVGRTMTYDVEMAPDGPLNFLANGIVSHNSHAACYALISYRTAWLKANYPAEYMAALISSVMDTKDKVPFFVNQAESMGIEILPPDVNLSDHEFVVVDGNIRFGLDAVKGVGFAAVEAIKGARDDGPFTSLWDFCERVDGRAVNKRSIEALIKCGAFGSTGATRRGMLEVLDSAQAAGQKAQLDAQIGQGSIFDLGGFGADDAGGGGGAALPFAGPTHPPISIEELDRPELLAGEKESIGIFITEHPLKRVREALRIRGDTVCSEVAERRDGEWVKVGGMISASKKIKTRSGATVMFATLDDLDGQVELLVFEKVILASEPALQPDEIVLVRGTVDHGENGKVCVKVTDVAPFAPSDAEIDRARDQAAALAAARAPRPLCLRVEAGRLPASVIGELKRIFEDFPGESEVVLEVHTRSGLRRLRFGEGFRVAGRNAALKAELARVLGSAVVQAVPQPA